MVGDQHVAWIQDEVVDALAAAGCKCRGDVAADPGRLFGRQRSIGQQSGERGPAEPTRDHENATVVEVGVDDAKNRRMFDPGRALRRLAHGCGLGMITIENKNAHGSVEYDVVAAPEGAPLAPRDLLHEVIPADESFHSDDATAIR